MKEIQIVSLEAVLQGQLVYAADEEIDSYLLYLRSPANTQTVHQVGTNDPILFGLGPDRIVGKVKAIIPRSIWRVQPVLERPTPIRAACIQFTEETIQQETFDIDAEVVTDPTFSHALICWGQGAAASFWVAVSERCYALIAADCLKGFFVILKP